MMRVYSIYVLGYTLPQACLLTNCVMNDIAQTSTQNILYKILDVYRELREMVQTART